MIKVQPKTNKTIQLNSKVKVKVKKIGCDLHISLENMQLAYIKVPLNEVDVITVHIKLNIRK